MEDGEVKAVYTKGVGMLYAIVSRFSKGGPGPVGKEDGFTMGHKECKLFAMKSPFELELVRSGSAKILGSPQLHWICFFS